MKASLFSLIVPAMLLLLLLLMISLIMPSSTGHKFGKLKFIQSNLLPERYHEQYSHPNMKNVTSTTTRTIDVATKTFLRQLYSSNGEGPCVDYVTPNITTASYPSGHLVRLVRSPTSLKAKEFLDSFCRGYLMRSYHRSAQYVTDIAFIQNQSDASTTPYEINSTRPLLLYVKQSSTSSQTSSTSTTSSGLRAACVYSGFIRDFLRMVYRGDNTRYFGSHKSNLWDHVKCDITMSTWDHHGVGSNKVNAGYGGYKQHEVDIVDLFRILVGNRLRVLHVQRYCLYDSFFKELSRVPRTFYGANQTVKSFMRYNDYSHAYKHYVAMMLAIGAATYDYVIKVRPDIRIPKAFSFCPHVNATSETFCIRLRTNADHRHTWKEVTMNFANQELLNDWYLPNDLSYVTTPTIAHCICNAWKVSFLGNQTGPVDTARDVHAQSPDTVDMNDLYAHYVTRRCGITRVEDKYTWSVVSRLIGKRYHACGGRNKQ
eukprot:PhF_6_TR14259/c0_g1_i2/m.22920